MFPATIVSVAFVLSVWLLASDPAAFDQPRRVILFYGVTNIVLFGWLAVVTIMALIRPGRLNLDTEGYWFHGLVRGPKIRWRDVAEFRVTRAGLATGVEARFKDGWASSPSSRLLDRIVRFMIDGDPFGGLVEAPKALCSILEEWRRRHAGDRVV